MDKLKLPDRLQAIASFVPHGAKVADIGTDHGYIPVWLAQNDLASKLTAADINKGPLQHAIRTAEAYGVTARIDSQLFSGLELPNSAAQDTIIIAGMGGELIASIWDAAPRTINGTTMILQPNSRIQLLVAWLIDHGYTIENARLVKDAGKLYQVLVVHGGNAAPIASEAACLVHSVYFRNRDPLLLDYLENLIARYRRAEKGMLAGKKETPESDRVHTLIQELENMKEVVLGWQQ